MEESAVGRVSKRVPLCAFYPNRLNCYFLQVGNLVFEFYLGSFERADYGVDFSVHWHQQKMDLAGPASSFYVR